MQQHREVTHTGMGREADKRGLAGALARGLHEFRAAGDGQLRLAQALYQLARLERLAGVILLYQLRGPIAQHETFGKALLVGERQTRDHEMREAVAGDQPPHQMQELVLRAHRCGVDLERHVCFGLAPRGRFVRILHSGHRAAALPPLWRLKRSWPGG